MIRQAKAGLHGGHEQQVSSVVIERGHEDTRPLRAQGVAVPVRRFLPDGNSGDEICKGEIHVPSFGLANR